jgi:hypothetical protein
LPLNSNVRPHVRTHLSSQSGRRRT